MLRTSLTRRCWHAVRPCAQQRSFGSNERSIRENDMVILRSVNSSSLENYVMTAPLNKGPKRLNFKHYGKIRPSAIAGKHHRDIIVTDKGRSLLVTHPTLEEYILKTPRIVTPIYPADAAAIVSLLDLHVTTPPSTPSKDWEPLEILEAGTGHGSLTLHLARAIQAANTQDGMEGAILHTIEVKPEVAELAKSNVQNFRRGMYGKGIKFNVGGVKEWLENEIKNRYNCQKSTAMKDESEFTVDSEDADVKMPIPTSTSEAHSLPLNPFSVEPAPSLSSRPVDSSTDREDTLRKSNEEHVEAASMSSISAEQGLSLAINDDSNNPHEESGSSSILSSTPVKPPDSSLNTDNSKSDFSTQSSTESPPSSSTSTQSCKPFLTAALLDLQSPEPLLPLLAQALHPDAFLGYFAPSISQITHLYRVIKENRFPFYVEKVIEFGNGGLRRWDVRLAKVRNPLPMASNHIVDTIPSEGAKNDTMVKEEWVDVCRPLVGHRVEGGGFYMVIRRMGEKMPIVDEVKAKAADRASSGAETIESHAVKAPESVDLKLENFTVGGEIGNVEVGNLANTSETIEKGEETPVGAETSDVIAAERFTDSRETLKVDVGSDTDTQKTDEQDHETSMDTDESEVKDLQELKDTPDVDITIKDNLEDTTERDTKVVDKSSNT